MDQQCTVTRSSVAGKASADVVEMFASLLQHPLKHHAGAPQPTPGNMPARDPPEHPLGLVPHQIRSYLSTWETNVIRGGSYAACSACSPVILDTFRRDGWEFVKKALMEKEYVAELSGLAEVQRQAEKMAAQVEWEDEEDGADEGDGELL